MLDVSNKYKKAILSDTRQFKLRCIINKKTYTEEDINSISWSGGAISGETFAIGSTVAADVKIVFSHIVEGIAESQEIKIEIGIDLPNEEVEYVPLGIFLVTEFDQKRNDNQTVIEGMDRFIQMEGSYKSKLNYPARIKDVAVEIANMSDVPFNQISFERLLTNKIDKPEGYTMRQAIGILAQFEGGFALFNRKGELEIRQLVDTDYKLTPSNYYSKGLNKNEALYRINGIQVKTGKSDELLVVGKQIGNQILLDNKVMTEQLLKLIYNKISDVNFYPFQLKWQGDPALEAGDWITIEDLEGNRFKVPNLNYSLSFNGGLSGISSASQKSVSQTSYQSRGTLPQFIDDIHGWISAEGGNWTYDSLDIPLNPKEGDTWFKPNGPDTELWRYEKNNQGVLDWVFKVSTVGNSKLKEAIEKQAKELKELTEQTQIAAEKATQASNQVDAQNKALVDLTNDFASTKTETKLKLQQLDQSLLSTVSKTYVDKQSGKLKADITKVEQDFKTVSSIVGSLQKDVAGKVSQTDYSSFVQRVDSIQQTVQGKADKSQVTQLDTQFQSIVETIGLEQMPQTPEQKKTYNLLKKSHVSQFSTSEIPWRVFSADGILVEKDGQRVVSTRQSQTPIIQIVNAEEQAIAYQSGIISFSLRVFFEENATVTGTIYYKEQGNTTFKNKQVVLTANKGWNTLKSENIALDVTVIKNLEVRLSFSAKPFIQWVKLENNRIATDWKPHVSEINDLPIEKGLLGDLGKVKSSITQLSNQINLKVEKGNLLSQINLEAERTLFQSKKIYLDAETVSFSGEAFIPMATIKDLKVDAATIYGTLDAKKVEVINLNAKRITSGELTTIRLKGPEISMDLSTGEVFFSKGKIQSADAVWDLSQGGLALRDKNILTGDDYFFKVDGSSLKFKGISTGELWVTAQSIQKVLPNYKNRVLTEINLSEVSEATKGSIGLRVKKDANNWGTQLHLKETALEIVADTLTIRDVGAASRMRAMKLVINRETYFGWGNENSYVLFGSQGKVLISTPTGDKIFK